MRSDDNEDCRCCGKAGLSTSSKPGFIAAMSEMLIGTDAFGCGQATLSSDRMNTDDSLATFLEDHGNDMLAWHDGAIRIETYYEKQFRALGGDTNRLIACFEEYGNMTEASRHYMKAQVWSSLVL